MGCLSTYNPIRLLILFGTLFITMNPRIKKPMAILILTSECDQKPRCRHCYLPLLEKWDPKKAAETTHMLIENGYGVTLTGAEVLTDPAFLECYRIAGQKHILSNGLALSKDNSLFSRIRDAGIEEIRFSLNFGSEGSLRSIPEHIVRIAAAACLDHGLRFQVATLITADNWQNISEYCKKAETMGASGIQFYRYTMMGAAELGREHMLRDNQLHQFYRLLHHARRELTINIQTMSGFEPVKETRERLASMGKHYCPAGEKMIAITGSGRVFGCPALIGKGKEIGRLMEDGTVEVAKQIEGNRGGCIAVQISNRD